MAQIETLCGTTSGYTKHYVRGETPCPPCKEAKAAYRKSNYQTKFPLVKEQFLKSLYNIDAVTYGKMLKEQNGLCALCGQPESRTHHATGKVFALAVDHDRKCCSGKKSCGNCVRGLLCLSCNLTIGRLENFLERGTLEQLIKYIQEA